MAKMRDPPLGERSWARAGRDHFLLRHPALPLGRSASEFAKASKSLMRPRLIVFFEPPVQIGLQLVG